ncbi:hypothetical protein OAQ15_04510 [Flavobacteriaceae bacterium]|nr:hypothetical protein [Flavobacteriaceae bacterium]
MADQKLTQRNAITETADDSLIHVVAGGASYKTTKANFLSNVPGYSPNNVSAVWTGTGNIFDVTADSYQVDGNTYSSTPGQVTLDVSDPILDRIDLIVAIAPVSPDTIGTVGKITGTPATLDLVVPPDYDPALVFPIKQVTIKADSGVPFKTTKEIVFNEGTEWVFTPLAPVFTLVTDDPYTGTKSIYADGASIPDKLKFTSATVFDSSNVDLLEFYIKSDNVSFDYINLVCQFQLAGSLVGRVGTWITDPQPNDWNRVQINKQQLALLGGTYDELVFYCSSPSGGANFWIDNIAIFEGSGADNANLNISQFINDVPYLRDGSNTSELNNDGSDGVNFFISKLDLNNTITVYNISSDFPGTSLAQLVLIINDTNGFIVTENEIVIHELTLNESTVKEKFIFKLGKGNFGNDGVPVVESNFESLKGATNTSQFINDGENGTSKYKEIIIPTDIRVIPNSVLPSTTQDVVVESKDMTSDSIVSFGTGLTINSQAVELNSFGSFIVRANVTLDATEQAIDVTVNNGLSGTAIGILNVVNGTVYVPVTADWTELSVSAPDISQTSKVISTVLGTNNSAVWDGVVDETVDFVIKFNIKISALGLQENSDRPNIFAIKQSGGTNIATLQYQVEGFGLLNTYTEALGGSLGQHKESVVGITSYTEAWEWLEDNVLPEFRWNATAGELSYWRRGVQIRVFPSGITTGTKLWFDAKYLDLVQIQYIDLSTTQAGDPYNDNYLATGDKISRLENDAEYLGVLESPYNTVIKGVASLLPTKYNLKNLFVTGTTAWTDADADKYIKNYYVDIPNDTITFYITRQYHLTIFAFNNASSLNTITHYLDWGGYVTEPGSQSFRGNTNIQEVVFPKATGDSTFCFENNSALTKLHLPYLDLAWVQNAPLLTDIDFSKAKSLINIKNIGAVGEMYAPLAKVVGFNQANGITSWYLPNVETLSGNMYNNSPITSLYAPNCKTYSALLRNANLITSLHLPNVTNASGLVARAFESDALTEIYMPKAKSFGSDSVINGMFSGSTIGVGCTLTVNEFLRTSNGGAMNVNVAQAISLGIKVVFAKDVNIALDNRILNASVTTTYDFDHSKASDWKLTMIADTTFTESNLPTLDKTIEYTFKLTGAFTPTFPTYWDVLGDAYDGAVWNFIAVQIHNGNSGTEEATVFISNIV